jgi:hypothetical protein
MALTFFKCELKLLHSTSSVLMNSGRELNEDVQTSCGKAMELAQ